MIKLLTIVLVALCPSYLIAQDINLRIALRAHSGVEKAHAKWDATAAFLTQAIPGYRFELVPYMHNSALIQAVSQGDFDFILTNPSAYVELEMRYGAQSLVTLVNKRRGEGYMRFGSVIFTRADRADINQLSDLKNKIFMAVDELGFGGWRVAWQELLRHDIDPFIHFSELRFAGGLQEKVVYAVRDAKVDAGSVRTDMLERMAASGTISLKDFKVLGEKNRQDFPFLLSTPLFPEWSFAKTKKTPNHLGIKVAQALQSIKADTQAAREGHYIGWVRSLDYTSVQALMEELRVGPYHLTSHQLLATAWADFKYLILSVIIIIVLFSVLIICKLKSLKQMS